MNALLLALLLAVPANAAEPPGTVDAHAFQYHAPILLEGAPQGFVRLTLTGEVIDKLNPAWGDMRLADDQNRTVPYLLRRDTPDYGASGARPGVCQGMEVLEDGGKAFLVDFGGPVRKNRIDLRDWMRDPWPLRVEGSTDQTEWRNLLDPEYRVQSRMDDNRPLSRWLQLEEGEHRWLRIVYAAGKAPTVSTFASPVLVGYVPEPKASGLVLVPLTRVEPVDPSPSRRGWSVVEWKVDCRNLRVALARFVVDDPYFSRDFVLEGSDDGRRWAGFCAGTLNRTQWEKHSVDALVTMRGFVTRARLRLTVNDGDNPPLSIQAPELWGMTGQLCFDVSGRKGVTLFFGNKGMAPPNYDLAQVVRDMRFDTMPEVKLGTPENRPLEVPDKGRPYFLWGMLTLAVCVMLAIVLNAMAGMRREDSKDGGASGDNEK